MGIFYYFIIIFKKKKTNKQNIQKTNTILVTPMSGYLEKQGEKGLLKTFKKRYFLFRNESNRLYYFYTKEDSLASLDKALGYIDIQNSRSVRIIENQPDK